MVGLGELGASVVVAITLCALYVVGWVLATIRIRPSIARDYPNNERVSPLGNDAHAAVVGLFWPVYVVVGTPLVLIGWIARKVRS